MTGFYSPEARQERLAREFASWPTDRLHLAPVDLRGTTKSSGEGFYRTCFSSIAERDAFIAQRRETDRLIDQRSCAILRTSRYCFKFQGA